MMIGDRINSISDSSFLPIPNEVMVLILQQLRVHDLGPRAEDEDEDSGSEYDSWEDCEY